MNSSARVTLNIGLILLGIFSAAFGLKGFLLSSHFIDGGVTGISMLLSSALGFPLAILISVINLPSSQSATNKSAKHLPSKARSPLPGCRCVWPSSNSRMLRPTNC